MTLSNATHGAPGKASTLHAKGDQGAAGAASVTGLEFLMAEGMDAPAVSSKDGVDFTALLQGIVQPGLAAGAGKSADEPMAAPVSRAGDGENLQNMPAKAAALLAMALGSKGGAEKGGADQAKTPAPATAKRVVTLGGHPAEKASRAIDAKAKPEGTEHEGEEQTDEALTTPVPLSVPVVEGELPQPVLAQLQAQAQAAQSVPPTDHQASSPDSNRRTDEHVGVAPAALSSGKRSESDVALPGLPKQEQPPTKPQTEGMNSPVYQAIADSPVAQQNAAAPLDIDRKSVSLSPEKKMEINIAVRTGSAPIEGEKRSAQGDDPARKELLGAVSEKVAASALRTDAQSPPVQQPQAQNAPSSVTPLPTLAPATGPSLGGALGQQVVDMGISGQWIDDIARQIASIAANPGHGSFRIASQELGAVRVDIAPSMAGGGSDVLMRVDSEVAFAALNEDKDRLVQDARMASVRIGELRIDRLAPMQEAQRGDMGGNASQQQQNGTAQQNNPSSTPQNGAQMGDRGGHQPGRQDASALAGQNQGGNTPKAPFTTTVLNGADADEANGPSRPGHGDSARYA